MLKLLSLFILSLIAIPFSNLNHENLQKSGVLLEKVSYFSAESDEFLSYWRNDFRKDEQGEIIPICDITYASYLAMYSKYVELNDEDRKTINATHDYEEGYTIKDSIKTLVEMYAHAPKNYSQERRTLDQSSTIIFIVVVAVFGMSTICVFFVLKNNNLIQ